jgi:hypothetical protein
MFDDLLRLRNALERGAEDLATARVLVDAALRQLQDRLEEFLVKHGQAIPAPRPQPPARSAAS